MNVNIDWVRDVELLPYHNGELLEDAVEEIFQAHGIFNAGEGVQDPISHNCFAGTKTGGQVAKGTEPKVSNLTIKENKSYLKEDFFEALDMCQILDNANYYIAQPNGTTDSPDHLYIQYGEVSKIECKSSRSNKFLFNNTLPTPQTIYIFSSKVHNITRVAMGYRLIETMEMPLEFLKEVDQRFHDFNIEGRQLAKDHNMPFYHFARKQFGTTGDSDFARISDEKGWNIDVLVYLNTRYNNANKSETPTIEIINTPVTETMIKSSPLMLHRSESKIDAIQSQKRITSIEEKGE